MNQIKKYLIFSQLVFFIDIILLIIVRPQGLIVNKGISYYGTHLNTLPLYVISLAGSTLIGFKIATKFFTTDQYLLIKYLLISLFPLTLALIIFPYNVNAIYNIIHESLGTFIFLFQAIISLLILINIRRDILNYSLFIIQIIAGLISGYYLFPSQGFLIQGQLLFQLAFGLILIKNSTYFIE